MRYQIGFIQIFSLNFLVLNSFGIKVSRLEIKKYTRLVVNRDKPESDLVTSPESGLPINIYKVFALNISLFPGAMTMTLGTGLASHQVVATCLHQSADSRHKQILDEFTRGK